MKEIPILNPERPIRGMRSSPSPASLPQGIASAIENLRVSDGVLTVRRGLEKITSAVPAGAEYRGHWAGTLNGTYTIIGAYRVSGATRLYRLAAGAWSEITEPAGAYGNTRMASDGAVAFAPVSDTSELAPIEVLVCSNGEGSPRIYNTDDSSVYAPPAPVAVHAEIPVPSGSFLSSPTVSGFLNVRRGDVVAITNSHAAQLEGTETADASTTDNEIQIDVKTGVTASATVTIEFSTANAAVYDGSASATAFRLNDSQQLLVAFEDARLPSAGEMLTVEVYSSATSSWWTVYDRSGLNVPPVVQAIEGSRVYIAGYDVRHKAGSNDLLQITRMRLSWKGPAPSATRTFRILGVMAGGFVPGGCQHALAYFNPGSRAESAGAVCTVTECDPLAQMGVSALRTERLPNSENLYYRYRILYPDLTQTGVSFARFFRREPGESDFLFLGSGGLQSLPQTPVLGTLNRKHDNVQPEDRDPHLAAPDAFHQPIPKARALLESSGRLFAGAPKDARSELWVSEYGNPFRFSPIVRFLSESEEDPLSPVRNAYAGEEVQALVRLPGTALGYSPVLMLTDRGAWRLEGADSRSLSLPTMLTPYGTRSPKTVIEHKGEVVYVDVEHDVRALGGASLSRQRIDDLLGLFAPQCAAVWRDSYYVVLEPDEEMGTQVAILDDATGEWLTDDYPIDIRGIGRMLLDGAAALAMFGADGHVYRAETAATDDDVPIGFRLLTRQYHMDYWRPALWSRVGVVSDSMPGEAILTDRVAAGGLSDPGEVDLPSTGIAYRYDSDASGGAPGIFSVACQYELRGMLPAGFRIYSVIGEIEEREVQADVAE
jgi:hypothetical protein